MEVILMPNPKKTESEQEFVSRCMGSDEMKSEFSDQEQRAAVCYSKYRDAKKSWNIDIIIENIVNRFN